ncbi:hypothetical protein GEMRC1_005741 [Eukaryota sp. GEM-RC1]
MISVDVSPHIIDVENGVFNFAPETTTQVSTEEFSSLKCFLQCFSIKVLTLKKCSFTTESICALSDLIRDNNSLTSVDFSYIGKAETQTRDGSNDVYIWNTSLSSDDFLKLINAFQLNTHLSKVNLNHSSMRFKTLMAIFELVAAKKLTPNIQVSPHLFDFAHGGIRYENEFENDSLVVVLNALKSNVPIKYVICHHGFQSLRIEGLFIVSRILTINRSVLNISLSPHYLDLENGVFWFSHECLTERTAKEVSSLQRF